MVAVLALAGVDARYHDGPQILHSDNNMRPADWLEGATVCCDLTIVSGADAAAATAAEVAKDRKYADLFASDDMRAGGYSFQPFGISTSGHWGLHALAKLRAWTARFRSARAQQRLPPGAPEEELRGALAIPFAETLHAQAAAWARVAAAKHLAGRPQKRALGQASYAATLPPSNSPRLPLPPQSLQMQPATQQPSHSPAHLHTPSSQSAALAHPIGIAARASHPPAHSSAVAAATSSTLSFLLALAADTAVVNFASSAAQSPARQAATSAPLSPPNSLNFSALYY
jgi:hypothetical protein